MECKKESAGLHNAKSALTLILIVIVINQSKLNPDSSTNQIVPS